MKPEKIIKIYVTKYALTQGILEMQAELCESISKDMVSVKGGPCGNQCFHKGQWFSDIEDAKKKANQMVDAKIKSLEKSLAKIKKIKF